MKKLTTAQQQVLDIAHKEIETAKKYKNYPDYYNEVEACSFNPLYRDYETVLKRDGEEFANRYKKYWDLKLKNIVLTHCSSATLRALEKAGYIRIIEDTANQRYGIDYIEVLA